MHGYLLFNKNHFHTCMLVIPCMSAYVHTCAHTRLMLVFLALLYLQAPTQMNTHLDYTALANQLAPRGTLVSLSLGTMLLPAWGWLIWGEGVIEGIRCDVKSHGLSGSREVSALCERHSGWSSHGSAPGTHFCHTLCPARNHSGWELAVTLRANSWVSLHISHQQQSPVLSVAHRSLPCTSNPLATFGKGDISHVHVFPKLCGSLMEGIDSVPIMGPQGRVCCICPSVF